MKRIAAKSLSALLIGLAAYAIKPESAVFAFLIACLFMTQSTDSRGAG